MKCIFNKKINYENEIIRNSLNAHACMTCGLATRRLELAVTCTDSMSTESYNGITSRRGLKHETMAVSAPNLEQKQVLHQAPSSHWTLMVVFISLLVDLLGFTVILPLIPSMLDYYGKTDQVSMYSLARCYVLTSPRVCIVWQGQPLKRER